MVSARRPLSPSLSPACRSTSRSIRENWAWSAPCTQILVAPTRLGSTAERRHLTDFLGEFVDHGRQSAIGILWDRRRQLERAHPRRGSDTNTANHSRACVVAVRTHRANAETITLICGACCLFSTH